MPARTAPTPSAAELVEPIDRLAPLARQGDRDRQAAALVLGHAQPARRRLAGLCRGRARRLYRLVPIRRDRDAPRRRVGRPGRHAVGRDGGRHHHRAGLDLGPIGEGDRRHGLDALAHDRPLGLGRVAPEHAAAGRGRAVLRRRGRLLRVARAAVRRRAEARLPLPALARVDPMGVPPAVGRHRLPHRAGRLGDLVERGLRALRGRLDVGQRRPAHRARVGHQHVGRLTAEPGREIGAGQVRRLQPGRRREKRRGVGLLALAALLPHEVRAGDHLARADLGVLEGHALDLGDHVEDAVATLDAGAERALLLRIPAPIAGTGVRRIHAFVSAQPGAGLWHPHSVLRIAA